MINICNILECKIIKFLKDSINAFRDSQESEKLLKRLTKENKLTREEKRELLKIESQSVFQFNIIYSLYKALGNFEEVKRILNKANQLAVHPFMLLDTIHKIKK